MKIFVRMAAVAAVFLLVMGAMDRVDVRAEEGDDPEISIDWESGPTTVSLGSEAELVVPEGYLFTGPEGARTLIEAMHDIPSGRETGLLVEEDDDWFVLFEFDDIGYVKDEEKDSLDADAILDSIKEGNDQANEMRRKNGWSTVNVVGWYIRPRYNETTNNLEWAVEGESDGVPGINLNTRILGRNGVMEVTLVSDPGRMDALMPVYAGLLEGYSYKQGNRYSEYVKGDKLAEVGLAALIVGGATAAAAKSGLLKGLWKVIVAGVVAVGAFFKKLFRRKSA